MATKSERMQLVQVIELLRQGNIEALVNVPQSLIVQATAQLGRGNRAIGVTVYDASGSIGITGIRSRPIVLYGSEWDTVAEVLQGDEFAKARKDPRVSTGSNDPRYADYRAKAKEKAKAEREARK